MVAGDRAGATLILPLPKKATDFTVSMEMDTAVSSMSPLTSSNANALVTDENKLRLVPSSGADMDADSIRIDVEFDLKVCDSPRSCLKVAFLPTQEVLKLLDSIPERLVTHSVLRNNISLHNIYFCY